MLERFKVASVALEFPKSGFADFLVCFERRVYARRPGKLVPHAPANDAEGGLPILMVRDHLPVRGSIASRQFYSAPYPGIMMRAWFRLSAGVILASLALPWISAGADAPPALGVFVLLFGLFTVPNLPAFLTGRVPRDRASGDLVTWSDAWMGFCIVAGWAMAVTYLVLARRSEKRTWLTHVCVIALPAVALAAFCGFAMLQGSSRELSWGFWIVCGGLVASVAREAMQVWKSRESQSG